jgi:hypothetical protein
MEVKRPATYRSAMRNIEDATSQIRDFGRPGFVALDLSPALSMGELSVALFAADALPKTIVGPQFLRAARQLSERVRGHRCQGKWSRLLGLFIFAKLHAWHHSNLTSPLMTVYFESPTFPDACHGLVQGTAERVRWVFRLGLETMTGTSVRDLG